MKYKKKILIFGGSGLAGLNFIKLFSKKYKILASYNLKSVIGKKLKVNLEANKAIKKRMIF